MSCLRSCILIKTKHSALKSLASTVILYHIIKPSKLKTSPELIDGRMSHNQQSLTTIQTSKRNQIMLDKRSFYINGQWTAPSAPNDYNVINPSTEIVEAVISMGSKTDTNRAVASARAAFHDWSQSTVTERIALIERILSIYKSRSDDMAQAISMEMGAPIDMAKQQQYGAGVWHINNFITALKQFSFEHPSHPNSSELIRYEPTGVCALITPWNWPMNQVTLKVIPALAAGCTMILKPSEIAPLSSMLFAEILHEAGCPAGVFNLINGDGVGAGTQLSNHPDVDLISFTGSTRAGTAISKEAADSIKRVRLELGGKGANIIFADADDKAVTRGARHCFNNSGQSCNAPTRMLVEKSRYQEAVEQAKAAAETTHVDLASLSGRHIGPVVSKTQFDRIQQLIEKGIEEGAQLVAGGVGKPAHLDKGYFVQPTVFANVHNKMTIAQEEIFGPVLSIIPFETEEEAIKIANDTPYGLANFIQTQNPERAMNVAQQLRSGMVRVNGMDISEVAPFGGFKQSGNGREGARWGIEEFLETKVITEFNL